MRIREENHVKDEASLSIVSIKIIQLFGCCYVSKRTKMMLDHCLKDTNKPVGVAEYKALPKNYEKYLPSPEQFQYLLDTLDPKEIENKN